MPSITALQTEEIDSLILQPCFAVPAFCAFYEELSSEIDLLLDSLRWGHYPQLTAIAGYDGESNLIVFKSLPVNGADEAFAVSHELYHVVLKRRGYPSSKTENVPSATKRVMSHYVNQLQHLIINPALQDFGFEVLTWWKVNDWIPFKHGMNENLLNNAIHSALLPINDQLEWALEWSRRELEYLVLTGNLPPEDFYWLRSNFSKVDLLAREIKDNVCRIGWDTPSEHYSSLVWFIKTYGIDVNITAVSHND